MPLPLKKFHTNLHRWYETHGRRELPWRTTSDPYAIYLSEIMLQQTQVATVLDRFYFQFLKRFPTIASLAKADESDVLHAWQGLGYYTRARNLHKAAKACKTMLPDNVEALLALPGIGKNTAHAVAAFAFRRPVAVMEANVKRVLCRIFALEHPTDAELWDYAKQLLDTQNPFDYNQAMMDIGAMICRKKSPLCAQCPANVICAGKENPETYPAAKAKKTVPVRAKNIVVMRNENGEYYATPRESKFLGGLYHFIEKDRDETTPHATLIGGVTQQYSHFTLDAAIYILPAKGSGKNWHSLAALQGLPMSMAEKKILLLIKRHCEEPSFFLIKLGDAAIQLAQHNLQILDCFATLAMTKENIL